MSGCKIGKVYKKTDAGKIRVIPYQRTFFHQSLEEVSVRIKPSTHAVGFFILDKDGTVVSGVSYDEGFTASQLKGACEQMKDSLVQDIWYD